MVSLSWQGQHMYTILVIARPTRQQFSKSHVDVRWEENREMATAEAAQFLKQLVLTRGIHGAFGRWLFK